MKFERDHITRAHLRFFRSADFPVRTNVGIFHCFQKSRSSPSVSRCCGLESPRSNHDWISSRVSTILALFFLVGTTAFAAPKPAAPEGNRFLFVVETSSAMLAFEHAGRQAAFDLIYSGINGQIHSNDTIGVWTFGETVHAGLFPMQVWVPEQKLQLASHIGLFVKNQHYDNQAHLDRVITKLLPLIATVKDLTVLIVSGSNAVWKGTTFDQEINLAYEKAARESGNAKLPIITTLVARNGNIVHRSVTVAGEPISLPQSPAMVNVAQSNTAQPSSTTNRAPVPNVTARAPVKNIIITSKKPVTNPEPQTATPSAAIPPSVSATFPVNPVDDKPTGASARPTESSTRAAGPDSGSPASQTLALPVTAPPNSAPNSLAAPIPVAAKETPPPLNISVTSSGGSPVARVTPRLNAAPSLLPALLPSAMPVAAREKPSATNMAVTGSAAPPLAVANLNPPESIFTPRGFFLIGAALTGCAITLLFAARRFLRPAPRPSYITRSMDRGR